MPMQWELLLLLMWAIAGVGCGKTKKLTMKKGKSAKLIVTRNPITAAEKITWTSSNQSVAAVNKKGVVKAKKKGKAKITVKSANGKKAVCTVTVK